MTKEGTALASYPLNRTIVDLNNVLLNLLQDIIQINDVRLKSCCTFLGHLAPFLERAQIFLSRSHRVGKNNFPEFSRWDFAEGAKGSALCPYTMFLLREREGSGLRALSVVVHARIGPLRIGGAVPAVIVRRRISYEGIPFASVSGAFLRCIWITRLLFSSASLRTRWRFAGPDKGFESGLQNDFAIGPGIFDSNASFQTMDLGKLGIIDKDIEGRAANGDQRRRRPDAVRIRPGHRAVGCRSGPVRSSN